MFKRKPTTRQNLGMSVNTSLGSNTGGPVPAVSGWTYATASSSTSVWPSGVPYPGYDPEDIQLGQATVALGLYCPECGELNHVTVHLPIKLKKARCAYCEKSFEWFIWKTKNWPLRTFNQCIEREFNAPDSEAVSGDHDVPQHDAELHGDVQPHQQNPTGGNT